MNKKSIFAWIVVIGLFILSVFWRTIIQNDLKKDGILIEAKIVGVNLGGKMGGGFKCSIKYKGKEKELSSPASIIKGSYDFVGRTLPAMYLPNSSILEVLITPKDFEKFNIPFPDSLNWVMPYVLDQ